MAARDSAEDRGRIAPAQLDEAALRDLVDAAFDALVIAHEGRVMFANRSFAEMSGYSLSEIEGRSVIDFVAPESRAYVLEQMQHMTERHYEARGLHRNGSRIDVEICARRVTFRGLPARLTAIRDISKRKDTEERLQRSERRLRLLIQHMTDMVLVHGRDGIVTFANPAALAYFGYADGEAIAGTPIDDLLRPTGDASSPVATVSGVRADGSTGVVEVARSEIEDIDGETAVLVLARDVSERKWSEARSVQVDLLASLGLLAASVAHEINNPLAYMTINLDVIGRAIESLKRHLQSGSATDLERAQDVVGKMAELLVVQREGAERVRRIVRDVRVFARGDRGHKRLIALESVLDSTIQLASSDIAQRARLVRDYEPVPVVEADEAQLGQLFLNLLVNAMQALDDRPDRNEIRVSTRTNEDGWVVVEIHDTGPGIPPDVLGRVFEPFFSTKPAGVGTGLGLAICRSIATRLGGSLTIESSLGVGTTCRVVLPAAPERAVTATATAAAERAQERPVSRTRRRVLVVDDEPAMLDALRVELAQVHDVTCASSGGEALALLAGESFDVVLCDLMMPGVSGIDVYERLRDRSPGAERRVIFMTGGAFTPRAQEFLGSVGNARLDKPFTWSELERALRADTGVWPGEPRL